MTISLTSPRVRAGQPRLGRCERSRLRRVLAEHDRHAARVAELAGIRALLDLASALVITGWVQHGWFVREDRTGRRHIITAHNLHVLPDAPVSGVCLVGAVVHAAGGPRTARTQLVQRTLDLTWHTLYRRSIEPVHWCPAPPVRAAHLRDLTQWNDDPQRTAADITTLLGAANEVAAAEIQRAHQRPVPADQRHGAAHR